MSEQRWTNATEAALMAAIWEFGHLGSPLDDAAKRDDPAAIAFTRGVARTALGALDRLGLLVAPSTPDGPRTWTLLPAEPSAEVKAVRDRDADLWVRWGDGWQMVGHEVCCAAYVRAWADLRFPLTDATGEVHSGQ